MKTAIKIIFLSLILIFCFQYFGGKKRLYYNKRYDLFIKVTELESGVGEVRLGKELVSLNSCIRFNYQGDDFPILFMIPRNDTMYVYDFNNNISNLSSGDFILHNVKKYPKQSYLVEKTKFVEWAFEDSVIIQSPQRIYIEWNLVPVIHDKDEQCVFKFQRIW